MFGMLYFIEHGNGEIGESDPAFAFGTDQQMILAQAEFAGALAFYKLGRG